MSETERKIVVLGVGNTLLQDEGIGIHALHRLADRPGLADALELIDGGTLSFTLAGIIEATDRLIVIDAARFGQAAGSVALYQGEEMDHYLNSTGKRSVHEVSLVDLLAIASLTESLPEHRALIGVEPEAVAWGMEPTASVAAALPEVVAQVERLVEEWNA